MMRPLNTYDLSSPNEDLYIEERSQVSAQIYMVMPKEERNTGTTIIINAKGKDTLRLAIRRYAIPLATSILILSTSFF
jgi:hypothetical protein